MATTTEPLAPDAPRWLFPLVVALHAAGLAALLAIAAPKVAPVVRALEIALLAPMAAPQPAPPKPRSEPRPAPQPVVATRPEPAPAPVVVAPAAAAVAAPATSGAPAETKPAPQAEAPAAVAPPRFDAAYLNNPRPAYPPLARRMGEEGRTVLRVLVSAEGLPEQIELRQSAGSPRLDAAAQEAVKRWRFVPARQGDKAVAAWVLVPLVFKLEN
ncbi:MAG: energy transducer TonB [Sterolibacteriaceae bacterium MAG5]|nr:energy transducer TonB [Candidatus Nitricoxidireducens bremensis]